jgi:PAS domain S-box-containing protein
MVLLLSFGLADKIKIMKETIENADKQYRYLVESSNEIIFSLDDNLKIKSINTAINRLLGFTPEEVYQSDFLELIQETWSERIEIARQIVKEYIAEMKKTGEDVAFRTTFRTKWGFEPKELMVRLERIGTDKTGYSILGKASSLIDDTLLQFLRYERFTYSMNNYISNAELLSQRLTQSLDKFTTPATVPAIRIALREAIMNSIEHGNLNLSYNEKTRSLESDKYHELIQSRQKDPRFKERTAVIEYSLNEERVIYKITDQGDGFNYSQFTDPASADSNNNLLEHGRGLMMITSIFDEVKFNDKGNQILMVKYFLLNSHI